MAAAAVTAMTFGCLLDAPVAKADDWVIGEARADVAPPTAATPRGRLDAAPRQFNIAPQPLADALDAFTDATGLLLLYNGRLTVNHASPGVQGVFTPEAALRQLLMGTNLTGYETNPGAVTLVSTGPGGQVAMILPAGTPMITLRPLHVSAPPETRNVYLYTASLQYSILSALQHDTNVREAKYRADVNVWVTPSGRVLRSQLDAYAGDADLQPKLLQVIRSVAFQQTPPPNLPQPVRVRIEALGLQ
jgi:hypothetical protein